jgi:drug/metabolite transporter (DMT)-like permease
MEMIAGGALLLVAGVVLGEWRHFAFAGVTMHSAIAWIYLTTFGSLVGFTAYVWLLKATTAARASTYAYVNPVVAVFLGWAVVGEPIAPRMLFAAIAIILAVVIIVTRSKEVPSET